MCNQLYISLTYYIGSLELVEVSEKLPSLVRRPGVSKWKVSESYSKVYESYNQVEQDSKLTESMFPPNKDVNLERCLRIYPHLQDAGGFFVAVIKKVSEFPYVKEERQEEPIPEVTETKEDTRETGEVEESDATGGKCFKLFCYFKSLTIQCRG